MRGSLLFASSCISVPLNFGLFIFIYGTISCLSPPQGGSLGNSRTRIVEEERVPFVWPLCSTDAFMHINIKTEGKGRVWVHIMEQSVPGWETGWQHCVMVPCVPARKDGIEIEIDRRGWGKIYPGCQQLSSLSDREWAFHTQPPGNWRCQEPSSCLWKEITFTDAIITINPT